MRKILFAAIFWTLGATAQEGAHPWTALPTQKEGHIRFAVLPDRTGGERAGVFAAAIPVINAQQPDFILSVGDLNDGYTSDSVYLDRQWREFEMLRSKLQAPYFYVPGNHDMATRLQADDWNRRFGGSYYHFRVRKNLFLVLNTDDEGQAGITDAQTAYFLSVLRDHIPGENLFVVMHRPLWAMPAGSGKMGYEALEKALSAHSYTLFCGHEHYYLKRTANGNPHYMLATLGGGSSLRGEVIGEFDHFLVVDIDAEQVRITSLLADGRIISEDIVTEADEPVVSMLRDEKWLQVLPTICAANHPAEIAARIVLSNPTSLPMRVRGRMPVIAGLTSKPSAIDHSVAPGQNDTLSIGFRAKQPIDIDGLPHTGITLSASFLTPKGKIEASASKRWYTDYLRQAGYTQIALSNRTPNFIREEWDWHGEQDGGFDFRLFSNNNDLYIDLTATDDHPIVETKSLSAPQDRFIIRLCEEGAAKMQEIVIYGGDRVVSHDIEGMLTNTETLPDGFRIRAIIPNGAFKGKRIRLNIGFVDQDNTTNVKPSVLWWQPEDPTLGIIQLN